MQSLHVDKVHNKNIEYEKGGQKKSFMKYGVQSGGQWYTLEGYGKDKVKEGDTVHGLILTRHYTKGDNSPGTEEIIRLASAMEKSLSDRIAYLERKIEAMEGGPDLEEKESPAGTSEDDPDLPF